MSRNAFAAMLVALTFALPASAQEMGDYGDLVMSGEGGGNWAATNPGSTATGGYQFIHGTLVDLGFVQAGGSTPSKGAGDWENVVWTGKGGVNSRAEFMASKSAQNLALSELNNTNWASISSVTPLGQTINGIAMTQGGALYAAHMLGSGGYSKWASCGFQAYCLDAGIAAAHNWTQEQYQAHLMGRIAAGGGVDPSLITASGYGGALEVEIPEVKLMLWKSPQLTPAVLSGQLE